MRWGDMAATLRTAARGARLWALVLAGVAAAAPLAIAAPSQVQPSAPLVSIHSPGPKSYQLYHHVRRIRTITTKSHRHHKVRVIVKRMRVLTFDGIADDSDGIAAVEMSVRRARMTEAKRCAFSDGARRFVSSECDRPRFFRVQVRGDYFVYHTKPSHSWKPGVYFLSVRATDAVGAVSDAVTVRFRLVD